MRISSYKMIHFYFIFYNVPNCSTFLLCSARRMHGMRIFFVIFIILSILCLAVRRISMFTSNFIHFIFIIAAHFVICGSFIPQTKFKYCILNETFRYEITWQSDVIYWIMNEQINRKVAHSTIQFPVFYVAYVEYRTKV